MRRKLRALRVDQKAWLYAKVSLAAWAIALLVFTPPTVSNALGITITALVSSSIVLGIGISIVGLFVAQSNFRVQILRGLAIELAGIYIAIAGPVSYAIVQAFLATAPDGYQRIHLIFAFHALAAFLLVRLIGVRQHRKKMIS